MAKPVGNPVDIRTSEAFHKLRNGYVRKLTARKEEITAAAKALLTAGNSALRKKSAERLSALAHQLVGSGATFGFSDLSVCARALEGRCEAFIQGGIRAREGNVDGLSESVGAVTAAIARAMEKKPPHVPEVGHTDTPDATVSCRVLVVDDDSSLAAYTQAVLDAAGMQAEVETNPDRVLERLARSRPDLILMDLRMPRIGGAELAATIRSQDSLKNIPIIFLSGEEDQWRRQQAMFHGDGYLQKPIDKETLTAMVTRVLGHELINGGEL